MNLSTRVVERGSLLRTYGSSDRDSWSAKLGGLQRFTSQAVRRRATRRAHTASEHPMERVLFWQQVRLEVERARRTERAFTVLCVRGLDQPDSVELTSTLHPHLRGTDAILPDSGGVLILLSETAGAGARRAVQRLAGLSCDRIRTSDVEAVVFPRDAITFGALVDGLIGPGAETPRSIAG